MTRDEAKILIQNASRLIEKIFRDDGELYAPLFHYRTGGGEDVVIQTPATGNDYDKDVNAAIVREKLARDDAVWVMMICEVWFVNYPRGASDDIRASEHPDRKEAVMYSFEDKNYYIDARQDIIRVEGRPRLGKLKFSKEATQLEGRLVGLLPKGRLSS